MAAVRAFLFCFSLFLYSRIPAAFHARSFEKVPCTERADWHSFSDSTAIVIIQIASHESYRWLYRNEETLLLPSIRQFSPRYGRINSSSSLIVPSPRGIRCLAIFDSIDVRSTFRDIFRSCVTLALIRSIPKLQRDRHRGISIPARFSLTLESVDISASWTLMAVTRDHLESNVCNVIQRCVTGARLRNKIARFRGIKIR